MIVSATADILVNFHRYRTTMFLNLFTLFVIAMVDASDLGCQKLEEFDDLEGLITNATGHLELLKSMEPEFEFDYFTSTVEIQQRFANGIHEAMRAARHTIRRENSSSEVQSLDLCHDVSKKMEAYESQERECLKEARSIYNKAVKALRGLKRDLNRKIKELKKISSSCDQQPLPPDCCDLDVVELKQTALQLISQANDRLTSEYTPKPDMLTNSKCLITELQAMRSAQSQVTTYFNSVLGRS